jgi:hypothetical protein
MFDPELAGLVAMWPQLSPHVRETILMLAHASTASPPKAFP